MVITPEEIDQGLERLAGAFADVLGQEAGHGAGPNTRSHG
jgi:hypothetical protein